MLTRGKSEMKNVVLGSVAALALTLVVGPACSSADPDATADENVVDVQISANQFSPDSITIKVGQTVRWTWGGGTHNVQSGASCDAPDDTFRSGVPQSGGTFERKFDKAGSFPYYCEPHCSMGMKGVVIVE
jgi:plastocyanin